MAERYHAFPDPAQDQLLGLILALGAEVWVLRDRIMLLEQALAERDVPVTELIEERARQPEHLAAVADDRAAFLERFLRVPTLELKN